MERAERDERAEGWRGSYEGASDLRLVEGMRAMDPWAYHEFFERLTPLLLEQAQRCGVRHEDRWMTVVELLDDLAVRLTKLRAPLPRSLEGTAIVALRRRLLTARRDGDRRRQLELEAASVLDAGEFVMASATSDASLRAADVGFAEAASGSDAPAGDDAAPDESGGAVQALGRALRLQLTPDDARLLEWVADRVPQHEAAEWLGVSHGAVRVRIHRLKARLRRAARRYEASLEGSERATVARFLDRVEGGAGDVRGDDVDRGAREARDAGGGEAA